MPASASIAADAGTIAGGTVPAPTITAVDSCDGALAVSTAITYPNGSSGSAWPGNGIFPIGTTQVTFAATDSAGNIASAGLTVTVADHQLLDATVSYAGAIRGAATRTLRVKAGASAQIVPVVMAPGVVAVTGIPVPVAAGYACVSAKDVRFGITSASAPVVVGRRYSASFAMTQGDANDDDLVDIADFSYFFVDRGGTVPADTRSNYNADGFVDNGDLGFISVNFFRSGQPCGGNADGAHPRDRISVKELRRTGRGELAAADLNHDGWVDMRDIQIFMQGGGGAVPVPEDAPSDGNGVAW